MARSPIVALIMAVIPVVNLYLFYKWFEELKAATKADYNSIVQLILCLIPIIQLYFLWKFFSNVENAAKKKGVGGYMFGATIMYILSFILFGLPFIYMIYKTQGLLNEL